MSNCLPVCKSSMTCVLKVTWSCVSWNRKESSLGYTSSVFQVLINLCIFKVCRTIPRSCQCEGKREACAICLRKLCRVICCFVRYFLFVWFFEDYFQELGRRISISTTACLSYVFKCYLRKLNLFNEERETNKEEAQKFDRENNITRVPGEVVQHEVTYPSFYYYKHGFEK